MQATKPSEVGHLEPTGPEAAYNHVHSRTPSANGPNVVLIVLDDLGFADPACYGSEIATPHIDSLAQNGLHYNNFHVTAMCSSTRACLLTGRNHHAVGMGSLANAATDFPGYTGRIPRSAATAARLLRDAGYNTFAVGKWHLTPPHELTAAGPFERWPLGMGFERYYGFLNAWTNQWTPDLVCDNGFVDQTVAPDNGYHLTEDLASHAIRLVQDQRNAATDKPFFLYFATGAPHSPHQVTDKWVERYHHRFDDGWEALRKRTFLRQQKLGIVPPGTTLTERPPWVPPWETLSADERLVFARQMEIYAGFISHADAQIGRVSKAFVDMGLINDTLLILCSDNGASGGGGPYGFFNFSHRYPSANVPQMRERLDDLGGFAADNHYAWGWAWASNTPLRLWKCYSWLGGVRVPLVVHWPRSIPKDNLGEVRSQFCHAIDVMPTILDVCGIDTPETIDGVSQQPIDGKSFAPTFSDATSPSPRDTQYFEMKGSRAVYHAGWKATTDHIDGTQPADRDLITGSRNFDTDRWSLFHLDDDFSEARDLATLDPERLRQMTELWWHEAGRNRVLPLIDGWAGREVATAARQAPPHRVPRRYVWVPSGGPIVTPVLAAGFRITAHIEVPSDRDAVHGVVFAHGDWRGGWACYLIDGRVVVTFNTTNANGTLDQIVTEDCLSAGHHRLSLSYRPSEGHRASAELCIDDRVLEHRSVPFPLPGEFIGSRFRPELRVGNDHGFAVCDDYKVPFPFSGRIHRLELQVAPISELQDPTTTGPESAIETTDD